MPAILDDERSSWKERLTLSDRAYDGHGRPVVLNESEPALLAESSRHFDALAIIDPPMSTRLDLKLRYVCRQFVRSVRTRGAYKVNAPKKRNDGIDFTLFDYLTLLALVATSDGALHRGLRDIPSFQNSWFVGPSDLAEARRSGDDPRPRWLEASLDVDAATGLNSATG